jgi:hypothetical protein
MTTIDNDFSAKTSNDYFNEYCNYNTSHECNYILHNDTIEHKNNAFSAKTSNHYFCEYCNYITSRKHNYKVHIESIKHKNNALVTKTSQTYVCAICNKSYGDRAGLWRHKKKCNTINTNIEKHETSDKHLIMMLLKQNSEIIKENSELRKEQSDIKEVILEIVKSSNINNSHNTINSHNKAFNLQFFLNETCKNAMNITDFVDSIRVQLSDFMSMGEIGYVEGISNIIVKNLNSLDETIRPIHCTDKKRETFYVKDQNIWEKEDNEKKKLKNMIKSISYKNEKLMKTYKEMYPDYNDPDSHRSDHYSKIMVEAMDCKEENREKIIKNISKVTAIKTK